MIVAAGALAWVGCGDDTRADGNGGSDTASVTAASTTATKASSQAVVSVDVSSSATGGATRPDGAPCTTDADCAGGTCFTEALYGFPGGQCTEDCGDTGSCSDPSSICDVNYCVRQCDPGVEGSCGARATLACHEVDEHVGLFEMPRLPSGPIWSDMASCAADCKADTDCSEGRVCDGDPLRPRCVEAEICDNMQNDNTSRYVSDCEDGTCAADPVCVAAYADECAAAVVLQPGRTSGDTSTGRASLVGNCAGDEASPEIVYSFTPPTTGEYTLHLTSESDLGFYLRERCDDRHSEIGCRNLYAAGDGPEDAFAYLVAGTTYTLVVDGGWVAPREGPFTLDVNLRGCNDGVCDYLPGDAPDGLSECQTCAADCSEHPSCGFCVDDGRCEPFVEALSCADCIDVVDQTACVVDGFCEQSTEGCACADCVGIANCAAD